MKNNHPNRSKNLFFDVVLIVDSENKLVSVSDNSDEAWEIAKSKNLDKQTLVEKVGILKTPKANN